ncbi:MAG: hypothetical protein KDD35_08550 [Bdellovibrionales bacterium]|nr:hypothetical protein [Bdellovibrionales bacterium]
MNIKSVAPQIPVLENRLKPEVSKEVSAYQSSDRDANGRQQQSDNHPHRPLTEEEIKKAMEILSELPGLHSSALELKLLTSESGAIVLVEGPNGETVRRLTEMDLWQVLQNQSKKTGQFLDKEL